MKRPTLFSVQTVQTVFRSGHDLDTPGVRVIVHLKRGVEGRPRRRPGFGLRYRPNVASLTLHNSRSIQNDKRDEINLMVISRVYIGVKGMEPSERSPRPETFIKTISFHTLFLLFKANPNGKVA